MSNRRFSFARLYLSLFILILMFLLVVARHGYLVSDQHHFLLEESKARTERRLKFSANKGKILDRNGYPLAISVPSYRVAIDPQKHEYIDSDTRVLADILKTTQEKIIKLINKNKDKHYVLLAKRLTKDQIERLSKLNWDGITLEEQKGRYYPLGPVVSTVIGHVDIEGLGKSGIEYQFNNYTDGQDGYMSYTQNLLNQVTKVHHYKPASIGESLHVTLDYRLQHLAYNALQDVVERHDAEFASSVVLSVKTGEILALANYPSFDSNKPIEKIDNRTKNHAISDLFEPGSIIKPIALTSVLKYSPHSNDEKVDALGGVYTYEGRDFKDHTDLGVLSFQDILLKSSNIAMVKLTSKLPPSHLINTYKDFGLFSPLYVQLPGESKGRHVSHPTVIDEAAMSYGYGLSVNLLSMAKAYNIIANAGKDPGIHLVFEHHRPDPEMVISEEITKQVTDMMVRVTEKGSSSFHAKVPGVSVAGKSGTSHILDQEGFYEDAYVSTFAGFAPSDNPEVVVAVMVYKPKKNGHYGGQVAAPVFSKILTDALSFYQN